MAKISGVNGSVMYGSVVVANQVTWSMSGISQTTTTAPTAFGDTGAKVKEVTDLPDAGTLEFNGNYDPADASGQRVLSELAKLGSHVSNLYLYVNSATWWEVGTGGYMIVTKADAVTLPRNAFGTISFSADISSAFMEQQGTGA